LKTNIKQDEANTTQLFYSLFSNIVKYLRDYRSFGISPRSCTSMKTQTGNEATGETNMKKL